MDKSKGIQRLLNQIDTFNLFNKGVDSPEFIQWRANALRVLDGIYRTNSRQYKDFADIPFSIPGALFSYRRYVDGLKQAETALKIYLEEIDDSEAVTVRGEKEKSNGMKKVFIVHGRERTPALDLARLLEKSHKIEAILLEEQAMGGNTIPEKLEEYDDVDYAFIILTPDDEGGLKGESLKERPRQNVVYEWGKFNEKLGRENVSVIVKGKMELPSDMAGIGELRFDKNIKECFYEVELDLKKAKIIP